MHAAWGMATKTMCVGDELYRVQCLVEPMLVAIVRLRRTIYTHNHPRLRTPSVYLPGVKQIKSLRPNRPLQGQPNIIRWFEPKCAAENIGIEAPCFHKFFGPLMGCD